MMVHIKKFISVILSVIMLSSLFPEYVTGAQETADLVKPTFVSEFTSSNSADDYLKLCAEGSSLSVDFHSSIYALEYRLSVISLNGDYKTLAYVTPEYDSNNIGNGFVIDIDTSVLNDDMYYFQITRARTEKQTVKSYYGDGGNCYRNIIINIDCGSVSILSYENILNNNKKIRNSYEYNCPDAFLDKKMKDVSFLLKDKSKNSRALTDSEMKYIKQIAQRETAGCTTAYSKARAVYKYVSGNIYYDLYSNTTTKDASVNPYDSIMSVESGKKTATVCTGYSSMMIAMLRSVGVPVRLIFGYHLSVPSESWSSISLKDITGYANHYWTEFYDGSEWVVCDATLGSSNKWNRNSAADKGEYVGGTRLDDGTTAKSLNNYTYFDPTDEQLSSTHYVQGIFSKLLINDKNDASRLISFLKQKNSSGITNAKYLGVPDSAYMPNGSILSWNYDKIYATHNTGKVEKISLSGTSSNNGKLSGSANFSNMNALKWLSISYNKGLTSLNLNGDSSLLSAYASSCSIKTVSAKNCKALNTLNVGYNPLVSAEYTFSGSKTAKITASSGGTFYLSYADSKHTVTAKSKSGYYFLGWYTPSGTKLSSSEKYVKSSGSSFELTAKFKKLSAPVNVKIKTSSPTSQKISWSKVSGASGYYVYKSTSKSGKYVRTTVKGGSSTSVTKTGLNCGKTYYYYVVAYRNKTISQKSSIVSKRAVPPTPAVSLTAGKKSISVKCKKISNVNGYQILRSTSKNGKYKVVKTFTKNVSGSSLTYKDSKLKSKKKYYYKMRAYKVVNGKRVYSAYSTVKYATTK